ncbi:Hypothetical_protein [Hexamita inflata]|uniref:Hypothetical_protein n=1 Tax=Hexamita inflata TaxID=28002 RepID=A0AA86QI40_9EUKA|nr:Hypothetical protein HINF_LOCUS41527 [Hexamita inflata]
MFENNPFNKQLALKSQRKMAMSPLKSYNSLLQNNSSKLSIGTPKTSNIPSKVFEPQQFITNNKQINKVLYQIQDRKQMKENGIMYGNKQSELNMIELVSDSEDEVDFSRLRAGQIINESKQMFDDIFDLNEQ